MIVRVVLFVMKAWIDQNIAGRRSVRLAKVVQFRGQGGSLIHTCKFEGWDHAG